MPTKYFLGFASSPELEQSAITLLDNFARNAKESQVPHMERSMDLFIPELLHSFLVGTVDAIGLSPMATRIVHSTADILDKTGKMLVGAMLKKRSNDELRPLAGYVDDIYIRPATASTGKASTGCEIDKQTYDRIQRLISEVRAGNGEQIRPELHDVMILVVDTMLEGFMKRAINLMKMNFIIKKLADGAFATSRAAGHGVVNKVFKDLSTDQLLHLANYFDNLVLSAER